MPVNEPGTVITPVLHHFASATVVWMIECLLAAKPAEVFPRMTR